MERIRPLPTFPRARRHPTMMGLSRPLWMTAEVQAWAIDHFSGKQPASARRAA